MMSVDPKWIRNPSDELAISQGGYFDESKGRHACDFIERFCRQSKGRWSGKPLELVPWQRDAIMRLFGWRKDGTRRFRTVYIEIPKKNGKSTLISAIALYLTIGEGEGAPEVYLNAVDRKQADIVFEECCRMVEASPQLAKRLNVSRYNGKVTDPRNYGKIQKNSADAPSADGVNASGVIFDEIHRFKSRALWDVFEYAGISRQQPLRIVITTAGEERDGIWYEQREFSEGINKGTHPITTHLGIVYRARTADDGQADDIDDPETWKKANPSMGHTMDIDSFAQELAEAKAKGPAALGNFLRLRLGVIVRGEGKFLDLAQWDACADWIEPDLDDPCFLGLDLSDRDDLAALVAITGDMETGFTAQCRFYLPEDGIEELERQHQQPYRMWAEEGFITLTPGCTIDRAFIRADIVRLSESRRVVAIFIDPWNARDLAEDLLNDDGLPVEFLRQGLQSLSDPTKTLRELVKARKIRHGGNPILRWHAGNAVEVRDANDNIRLDKKLSRKKIDGMAALVNAVAGAIARGGDFGPSIYETRGLVTVN